MGLTDVYYMRYSLVADHYEYIAILGVVACVAAGAARLVTLAREPVADASRSAPRPALKGILNGLGFGRPWAVRLWCVALLTVLGLGARLESRQYANAETLYQTTLKKNPSSWLMHNLLGVRLVDTSIDEAIAHFREAARLNPDLLEAHATICVWRSNIWAIRTKRSRSVRRPSGSIRRRPRLTTAWAWLCWRRGGRTRHERSSKRPCG